MSKRNIVIGTLVVVVIVFVAMHFGGGSSRSSQEVATGEPVDIALDFYDQWSAAINASDTNPYDAGLAEYPVLSPELRNSLKDAENSESDVDPVLCQTSVPQTLAAIPVYENETGAQFLVRSRDDGAVGQAIVTLSSLNEGWYIKDISCSLDESAPDREFSFEKDGFLLKSVPPPLDSDYWHLVFEENGQQGHFAPLFFGPESMCTEGRSTSVCDLSTFADADAAFVQGELSETGVEVKRLELK